VQHGEDQQQAALFDWIRIHEANWPMLRFCFHVPNGGARSKITGALLQRQGVRRGCPDIWFPFPAQDKYGLIIELKYGRNKPSPEQKEWLTWLASQGFKTAVCYSWVQAAAVIREYLGMANDMFEETL
jgi:hypothetical protein